MMEKMDEIRQIISKPLLQLSNLLSNLLPINPLVAGEPLQFDIAESLDQFTDSSFSYMYGSKLLKGTGIN